MKINIKMPTEDKYSNVREVISRKVRKNNEIVIDTIKYRVPKDINDGETIDYFDLELEKTFYQILVEFFEKVGISDELIVQIYDIDVTTIYNDRHESTFSLTLDYLITEAEHVKDKFLTGGWSHSEDYNSTDPETRKWAKKEVRKLKKYIKRYSNVMKLLKQQGEYKDLAILPIEVEGVKEDYIIYPPIKQEKVIRLNAEELKEEYKLVNNGELKPRKQIKGDNYILIEQKANKIVKDCNKIRKEWQK